MTSEKTEDPAVVIENVAGEEDLKPSPDTEAILDPVQTSVGVLDDFFNEMHEEMLFEKIINIVDTFNLKEDYKINHKHHYKTLLVHSARAHAALKTETSLPTAKEMYQMAIDLLPDKTSYITCFSYAQLLTGKEAVSMYEKGISIVEKEIGELKAVQNDYTQTMTAIDIDISCEQKQVITKNQFKEASLSVHGLMGKLHSAYTSLGEIYVTDLKEETNSLELAESYANKANKIFETLEVLLLYFSIHHLQQNDLEKYPDALQHSRKVIKKAAVALMSEIENSEYELNLDIVDKCVKAAISVDCFAESFAVINIIQHYAGSNNKIVLSLKALHYYSCTKYNLKGFCHYANLLTESIRGLEMAHEDTEEIKEMKVWINDLQKNTQKSIDVEDTSSVIEEFDEVLPFSPLSEDGNDMIQEIDISSSEDSDSDVVSAREDDDSCVIIDEENSDSREIVLPKTANKNAN